MRGALLDFWLLQSQQTVDIALGALRAVDILRPVTPLMPARDDELKQIDDVVGAAIFLLSEESTFMTGQGIPVNGGIGMV